MMKLAFLSTVVVMLLAAVCPPAFAQNAGGKPNVLVILVDDLGYNDVGFLGSDYYETPNIDRLASAGTVFTSAYSNSRVCSPSRASIMLGQFTARHGITDWIGARMGERWRKAGRHDRMLPATYKEHLPHGATTLPEAMKAQGYKTFFAGKWHLGGEGSFPEDHGFDINKGGYHSGSPRGGYFSPYDNPKLTDGPDGESLTLRLADETSAFIRKHKAGSFFAYLSFYAVHGPIQTTKARWEKYRAKAERQGIAPEGFVMGDVLPVRLHQDNPVYAGLVETMDEAVGRVLRTLEEEGLADNTIVVFTSDNGGVVSGDAYSTNLAPLKGGKGNQWEGGIRVPMIIKLPGTADHVERVDSPVAGSDLFPTILELSGCELLPDTHRDGLSLVPLLHGGDLAERPLIWHYPHYGNQGGKPSSIIRKGAWKLIHYYEDGRNELYNVAGDVEELQEQSAAHPQKAEELYGELTAYLDAIQARYPVPDPEYDVAKREQWETGIKTGKLPQLELQRKEMLSEGYRPNEDWWGSDLYKSHK